MTMYMHVHRRTVGVHDYPTRGNHVHRRTLGAAAFSMLTILVVSIVNDDFYYYRHQESHFQYGTAPKLADLWMPMVDRSLVTYVHVVDSGAPSRVQMRNQVGFQRVVLKVALRLRTSLGRHRSPRSNRGASRYSIP